MYICKTFTVKTAHYTLWPTGEEETSVIKHMLAVIIVLNCDEHMVGPAFLHINNNNNKLLK